MEKIKNMYYDTDSVLKYANIHGGYTMNDSIKITVKRSEIEYCFKAENYAEFEQRFNVLKDIMHQRFINALAKRDIMCISEYIINANRGENK